MYEIKNAGWYTIYLIELNQRLMDTEEVVTVLVYNYMKDIATVTVTPATWRFRISLVYGWLPVLRLCLSV